LPGAVLNGLGGDHNDQPSIGNGDWQISEYWTPMVSYTLWLMAELPNPNKRIELFCIKEFNLIYLNQYYDEYQNTQILFFSSYFLFSMPLQLRHSIFLNTGLSVMGKL